MGNIDVEFNRWKEMKEEISTLFIKSNFVEIFLKRKDYHKQLDEMKYYLNKQVYFFEEDCFFSQVKSHVYERVRDDMSKLLNIFDFV